MSTQPEGSAADAGGRVLFEFEGVPSNGLARIVRRKTETGMALLFPEETSLLQNAGLVVSELVANASEAARDRLAVRVSAEPRGVYLEVTDDGPGEPRLRRPTLDDPTGRGLLVVNAISDRWGCIPRGSRGKTVWARCSVSRGGEGC